MFVTTLRIRALISQVRLSESTCQDFYGTVGVGSTIVGASVGGSVGGIEVFVGAGCGVFVGCDVLVGRGVLVGILVGRGVLVGMLVGVLVGLGVLVLVGMDVLVRMGVGVLCPPPLIEGFVPQSLCAFIQFVTSACKAAGSQALKKS